MFILVALEKVNEFGKKELRRDSGISSVGSVSTGKRLGALPATFRLGGRPDMQQTYGISGCASPIESIFARAFFNIRPFHGLMIQTQFRLCQFRYDFAITLRAHIFGPLKPALLIECDGKAFHSTHEQIKNDQKKNELAAKCGIPLIRFTGSELYRHRDRCAEKIFYLLRGEKWAS